MKNLEIETSLRNKSWEELAEIIFDLIIDQNRLKTEIKDVKKREEYWFQLSEEWRLKYIEASKKE